MGDEIDDKRAYTPQTNGFQLLVQGPDEGMEEHNHAKHESTRPGKLMELARTLDCGASSFQIDSTLNYLKSVDGSPRGIL